MIIISDETLGIHFDIKRQKPYLRDTKAPRISDDALEKITRRSNVAMQPDRGMQLLMHVQHATLQRATCGSHALETPQPLQRECPITPARSKWNANEARCGNLLLRKTVTLLAKERMASFAS